MEKVYFTKDTQNSIKNEIKNASFNEVFFVANLNENMVVNEVSVLARGNKYAVPAVIDGIELGQVVIHNHPSGNLTPSDQDIRIAAVFRNKGVGFYIINNDLSDVYVVAEPYVKKEDVLIDKDSVKKLLLPDGSISKLLKNKYEYRLEQLKALETIVDSYNNQNISIIEAGTGTGKTFSYLIPSLEWAINNEERVVISTNTINLQEQLINKDIPLLKNAVKKDFKYALIKGMRNYLCLLRTETLNDGMFDFVDDSEKKTLESIINWSKKTKDGSRSDLSFSPPDDIWEKVSAESDSCMRSRCPHYDQCFFYKSRRDVADSSLIVVNHHLLFSDLAIKELDSEIEIGIIPKYNRVVFDEAHNLVDSATSHFGMQLNKYDVVRVLRRLKSVDKSNKPKGLIFYLPSLASKVKDQFVKDILEKAVEIFLPMVDYIEGYNDDAFDSLYNFGLLVFDESFHNKTEINIRVTERVYEQVGWDEIFNKFVLLKDSLVKLHEEIMNFIELIEINEDRDSFFNLIAEYKGVKNKIYHYSNVIDTFLNRSEDNYIRWIEGKEGEKGIFCSMGLSPLNVSSELNEKVYSKAKTVVMTSATLSVEKNFDFQKYHLGLTDNERIDELIVDSPFNFQKQALLLVPKDIPEPNRSSYEDYIAKIIFESIKVSNGNALLLFTSYASLNKVFSNVKSKLKNIQNSTIQLLKQGDLPRTKLLEKFKIVNNAVLFATNSFWEGVDVPGESLKLVVICRLPFKVPTDPVNEARVEHLESKGINPFLEYTLPLATLKFKQGFGRLIRTKTDKGVVMVLDKRIISKSYGDIFLRSLPDCRIFKGRTKEVIQNLSEFLN